MLAYHRMCKKQQWMIQLQEKIYSSKQKQKKVTCKDMDKPMALLHIHNTGFTLLKTWERNQTWWEQERHTGLPWQCQFPYSGQAYPVFKPSLKTHQQDGKSLTECSYWLYKEIQIQFLLHFLAFCTTKQSRTAVGWFCRIKAQCTITQEAFSLTFFINACSWDYWRLRSDTVCLPIWSSTVG